MTLVGWLQIALYCAVVVALVKPLGWYMTRVFSGERTFLSPVLRPVEVGLYKISGVNDRSEQDWLRYTVSMLLFHIGGFLILYVLLRTQGALPFNPQGMTAVRAGSVVQHRHQLHHEYELAELRRRSRRCRIWRRCSG